MGNRILIVSDAWTPQVNGVVQTIKETVKVLENWGYQVKVISPSNFVHFPLPSYPEIKLAIPTKHKLAKLITEFNPSAIHIATEGPLGWATRKYCLRNKLPFTTVFHTRFPEYINKRVRVVPISLGYKFLALFHKKATKVLIPNQTMADIFRKYGINNLAYWVRGVDTNTFQPNKQPTTYKHPVMITICRLSPEKNLEAFFNLDIKGTKIVISGGP